MTMHLGKILLVLAIQTSMSSSFGQIITPAQLLGDWRGSNTEKKIELSFIDSNQVIINSDFIRNRTCPFIVENIRGQNILNIRVNSNATELKLYLWINSGEEIKLLSVDAMNYKNPMKNPPTGNEAKCIILKKQKPSVSG